MSAAAVATTSAKKAGFEGESDAQVFHKIRITLTSRNVKNIEKGMPCVV